MTKKLKISVVILSVVAALFVVVGGLGVRASGNDDGAYPATGRLQRSAAAHS